MSQSTQPKSKRKLIIGATAIGILIALISGILYYRQRNQDGPATNPTIQTETNNNTFTAEFATGPGSSSAAAQLILYLSQGQAQIDSQPANPLVTGDPLSEAEIAQILARLPALTGQSDDEQPFNLPDDLLPPPRPGQTITQTFPPPPSEADLPIVADGPLEVLRYTPEGEVGLAPFINITFNQPMVPLTSLEALAATDVPATISPALPGIWQWLSPQTLRFEFQSEAVDRLPMATEFVVEIPAGTQSANGNSLAQTVRWSFSTPPVQLANSYPASREAQPLEPLIFVAFDQLIEPTAVLPTISLSANSTNQPIRLATAAEIAADSQISRLSQQSRTGYWLVFRPERPLPTAADIIITIGPGTPSSEGPRLTTEAQSFSFSTYHPLQLNRHTCGWSDRDCPPLTPFQLEFNNPLDPASFDQSMISIQPELPGATMQLNHNRITIQGLTQGRTTYRVTIDSSLQDIFGQTLGSAETVRFSVDRATPFVSGPNQFLTTTDPSATEPALTLYVMNYNRLQVRMYAVGPEDWPAYLAYRRAFDQEDAEPTPPGRLVLNETMPIEQQEDVLTETAVNLSQALQGSTGHLIVVIQTPGGIFQDRWQRRNQTIQTWAQVTQIGLDALVDHSQVVAWATNLSNGAPLSDATITPYPNGSSQPTDSNGLAHLSLATGNINLLVAQRGNDTAILPASLYYWDQNGWQQQTRTNELRWHIFDDRAMYRPDEEIHLKGWLRHISPDGLITLPSSQLETINYRAYDAQGNEIANGTTSLNPFGGFDLNFTIPSNSNLGYAYINLEAPGTPTSLNGRNAHHNFQIQEFRRPEFEVSARQESSGPYVVGDAATVAVSASYFAGGPLANADTTWAVTSTPGSYSPPNWPGFTFGTWTPWWWYDYASPYTGFPGPGNQEVATFSGLTDASGEHYLQIDFEALEGNQPFTVSAEGTVMDVNRQAWSASTSLLVHPASLYVGLRSQRTFVKQGEPLEIEAIVSDIDGNAVAGTAVLLTASRLEWLYRDGQWREEAADSQECALTSTTEPLTCTFNTDKGGQYRITAVLTDAQGQQNQSQLTRWVAGGSRPTQRNVEQESLTLIPDREEYQPGDVAEILIQAPFSPAEGLLTLNRNGILSNQTFQLEEGTATLQIPISQEHIPNLAIQVDVVGSAPRTDDAGNEIANVPPRPAFATGSLTLNVPPHSRELSLTVVPQTDRLEPGEQTAVTITVTDANNQPVSNAEVALVVVDESILALTNYQLSNPLDIFYTPQWAWLESRYGRGSIILANPQDLADKAAQAAGVGQVVEVTRVVAEAEEGLALMETAAFDSVAAPTMAAAGNAARDESAPATPIDIRTNFNPLAIFAPSTQTNATGQAQVSFTLPDNLTRYRIMAVAVAGERQFGTGESNLTARLPLMVRPSAPRFLNFGDQFELPIVVQNQTDQPMTVDIALDVTNLQLLTAAGQRVTVPANDRVEVRFPATTLNPGTARFQVAAVSGSYADAATGELPVYTPATTEAFATYGVLDGGAIAQPFLMPDGLIPGFGGLEIGTSSTALQALTDAVLYLTDYPYSSSDALASRILTVAALRDVLTAFEANNLPEPAALITAVQRDIEQLQGLQNNDGGFAVWERGRDSIPFYTIHAAHALAIAQQKGFTVSANSQNNMLSYLRNVEDYYPPWYSQRIRHSLSAYALYVRHLTGDTDSAKARNLLNEAGLENLPLEATAWLWLVLADDATAVAAIRQHINNRAVETAATANFITDYGDEAYLMLHSNRRTDGIILNSLISLEPQSDLIPKVVAGLLAHRTNGRWANSQENVFILLALDRYFNTYEAQTPDFVAQIWLGDGYAGEQSFIGRSTDRYQIDIPMDYLAAQEAGNVLVSMTGNGRLYYRLALNYAPADLVLDPLNRGFVVQRSYEGVDNPDDVWQDEDGTWHIKLGARVRVRLTMIADNRRYHVALVDPLPAGLEAINPALAVSQSAPPDPNSGPVPYWWWGNWYQHQNMRDERLEAFTTLLWEGVYTYDYIARATTPGTFVAPPTKAEEMYAPEVFGRSGSDVVIVE